MPGAIIRGNMVRTMWMIPGGNQVIAKDIIRTTGFRVIIFQLIQTFYIELYIEELGWGHKSVKIHKIKYLDIEFK